MPSLRKSPENALIGRALKSARRKAGLRQVDVATAIGVGPKTYEQWEQGYVAIKAKYLSPIAEALGIELGDLASLLDASRGTQFLSAAGAAESETRAWTHESAQALAAALWYYRHELDLSQGELSVLTGVPQRYIASLEAAAREGSRLPRRPSTETLQRLAAGLGTRRDDLFQTDRDFAASIRRELMFAAGYRNEIDIAAIQAMRDVPDDIDRTRKVLRVLKQFSVKMRDANSVLTEMTDLFSAAQAVGLIDPESEEAESIRSHLQIAIERLGDMIRQHGEIANNVGESIHSESVSNKVDGEHPDEADEKADDERADPPMNSHP